MAIHRISPAIAAAVIMVGTASTTPPEGTPVIDPGDG